MDSEHDTSSLVELREPVTHSYLIDQRIKQLDLKSEFQKRRRPYCEMDEDGNLVRWHPDTGYERL